MESPGHNLTQYQMPRHSSYITSEQKKAILKMVAVGCERNVAAKAMQVTPSQLRRQLNSDPDFAAELLRNEGAAELQRMTTLHKAGKDVKHWRAASWWLEQKAKKRQARSRAKQVTTREMQAYLAELIDEIFSGVKCDEDRERVLQRLAEMANALDARVEEPDENQP